MVRRSLLSGVFGGLLGLVALAAIALSLVLVQPERVRALFLGLPTPGADGNPGQAAPPTAEPLPTSADAACGGPEHMVVALLGVDDRGSDYATASRTDSISLVNVRFTDHRATLLSIPRDLYVPLPDLGDYGIYQDRINTAFEFGEIWLGPGYGPSEFKNTVALNFGIRVDRYVLINFRAFVAAVDAVGGIDVDVPEYVYDAHFPADEGYGTIVFEMQAGRQHMDGATALRYARTRHQDGDFQRSARQQLVLLALRDKLISPDVIPQLPALLASLGGLAQTDLSPQDMAALACIGPKIERAAITTLAIDGTMVTPWRTFTGGSVVIPNREAMAPTVQAFLGQ